MAAIAGVLLLGLTALARQAAGPVITPSPFPPMLLVPGQSPLPQWMLDRMERERAKINQVKIRKETVQLVRLSRRLQHLLIHATPDALPATALKDAKQIEKLAHKISNRLRSGGE